MCTGTVHNGPSSNITNGYQKFKNKGDIITLKLQFTSNNKYGLFTAKINQDTEFVISKRAKRGNVIKYQLTMSTYNTSACLKLLSIHNIVY